MEASSELISSRREKINAIITGKTLKTNSLFLLHREALLDTLQALYDECSIETLKKYDKQIALFVDKYKSTILNLKQLRVNVTDFEIKDVIGRGHFGEVHVVKEKQTGDIYAMKTIRKTDSLEKTSFDIERDIMAFSHSSWLTSLQYAFQDTTYLFFVMEYHPGGDLLGLLYRQGGTLPETAATFYIAELVLALEDLHQMGYVHRDIKPDNVLLDRCGHLKLVDFGSAAKLDANGCVSKGPPVGTPDYVAPEVLQFVEKNNKKTGYGISCDYWSLGVLAYELVIGKSPFTSQNTTTTYSRIMNHTNLKFPSDVLLTQAYVSFVKALVTDEKARMSQKQIKQHVLFKNHHFDSLRDQVPPFVPKISSLDDTSNFSDILPKKSGPDIENFKKKTQFSGRNLPFIGFTFTQDANSNVFEKFGRVSSTKDEVIKSLKTDLEEKKRLLMKCGDYEDAKLGLEKKIIEKTQKLENVESVRNKLERDLASSIAECTALKRTLEMERKDRSDLEKKALDLIKSAKTKWENSERSKVEALNLEIQQQSDKIIQLTTTNSMLNEQLQRAFKMEDKHRESLDIVEKLSRRSVVGLESRLEKITLETKHTVSSLQDQLDDVCHEKNRLESEVARLLNNERDLLEKLNDSEQNYEKLRGQVDEAERVIRELGNKVNSLEEDLETSEDYKRQLEELGFELNKQKIAVKDLEKRNSLLQVENNTIEEYKNELNSLKLAKCEISKQISDLETKLSEERDKNASLKKQLEESEVLANETQQLKELRMKMWKVEKEFSNCKIDKRILERELKESEKSVKELKAEISALNESVQSGKKQHEKALLELSNINETLSLDLVKAKKCVKNLEEKYESEKDKFGEEKHVVNELKNVIRTKDAKISEMNQQINAICVEKKILQNRCEDVDAEKTRLLNELGEVKKSKQQALNEKAGMTKQLENTQLNLEALREACTLLENQVIEYENLNKKIQVEKASLSSNVEKLIADVCSAKEDIQNAKKQTNEEKSLRLLVEMKLKRLNEDIEGVKSECNSYKLQSEQFKNLSNKLSDELTLLEEKNSDLEVTVKSYERQLDDFISENTLLKEEISQYLTQINALKESSFRVKQQIADFKQNERIYEEKIDELERKLNEKISFYEERELKSVSTVKQQTKLIEYLQVKIDEQANKKKTFTNKLFGSSKKENQPPVQLPSIAKDVEVELQREKRLNRNLQEEVYRLKAEIVSRQNANVLQRAKSDLVASPRRKAIEVEREPVVEQQKLQKTETPETSHNIPVRIKLPESVSVNCVVDLTKNIKILGTKTGLFSFFNNSLLKIDGLDEIHHVAIVAGTNTVIMVAGAKKSLVSCDLNHLINLTQCAPCTKPKLTFKELEINNLDMFTFLLASTHAKQQIFCAATSKQLVLARFDVDEEERGGFVPLRVMDTAEPVSCALFTEHTLIVGADKVFEIDLSSFQAEEFLDSSDVALQPAVKCHKMRSFPLAVLELFANPKEYLVCFREFCIFVDEYGRSSRSVDITPNYLPVAFGFTAPFLYVVQFAGVEVLQLSEQGLGEQQILVELKEVRFVGSNKHGVYVEHGSEVKLLEGRRLLGLHDDSSSVSESTEMDEEDDRFSFTSSIMQSLDGNLSSDTNDSCQIDAKRKVHFSQTNL